ncbi:MAG: SPOR domain-containing protein, partial [Vicinamibacteria bacterium]
MTIPTEASPCASPSSTSIAPGIRATRILRILGAFALLAVAGCHSGDSQSKPKPPARPGPGSTPKYTPTPAATPASSPSASVRPAPGLPDNPAIAATLIAPTIRIGFVVDATRVSVGGADAGMRVWAGKSKSVAQRLTFELANPAAGSSVRFRVQAASVADLAVAQASAKKIADSTGISAEPIWNDTTKTYQVKAGSFPAREDAAALSRQLSTNGFAGAFVVTDAPVGAPLGLVRIVETGEMAP